jgi:uncharacterized protein
MSTASTLPGGRPLALVTGASAGIGYQLALQLADARYDLVATGRSEAIGRAGAVFEERGVRVSAVRADLTRYDQVESVWQAVVDAGRPLDVAVLNAGASLGGAFVDTDLEDELNLLSLNVTSVVHLAKHVARQMAARRRGRILITSSISATKPTPFETVYGPTRAFTYMFAQGLREEMKDFDVSVTALLPGATDSEFHARAGMSNTAFGPTMAKNSRVEVARQGLEALMAGKDHVVAGDRATKLAALRNRFARETAKAARHARKARPRPSRSDPESTGSC